MQDRAASVQQGPLPIPCALTYVREPERSSFETCFQQSVGRRKYHIRAEAHPELVRGKRVVELGEQLDCL